MAGKTLVIVESPTKAKTITKFLGKDYIVKASNGHIRDLPNSAKEIPAKYKGEKWSRLGVNVERDFEALYVIPPGKKEQVKVLKEAMLEATEVLLATDEDREGESISWHLLEILQPKVPTKRLVFHEITKEAIALALASPREVDENLVKAQETRRIVDRLFGYEVSPILWRKIVPRLSAGRVQSVAIRLLVDRERARMRFRTASYWGIKGQFSKGGPSEQFEAELTYVGDKRAAGGKDFDPNTGNLVNEGSVVVLNSKTAPELCDSIQNTKATVGSVEEKPFTSKPAPPFVTSTLQQEGNRKLRVSAKRVMTIAQQLYENGFITYMRTDSTTLSQQALDAARKFIKDEYGGEYLPEKPRLYATKVRNAQEAHEAIRPAGDSFTPPEVVRSQLGDEAFRLYDLIWKRTVASQMADARGTYVTVALSSGPAKFRASGKTIEFPGFLRAYVEGSDDPEADLADQERILPKLQTGDQLNIVSLTPSEHATQPPARFTEGSIIKELERLGIGRPSTWATIVELVLDRRYAFKKGTALVPTFTAFAVVKLLETNFSLLLDYEFTARLEDDLDAISRGEAASLGYLKQFYFGNGHPGLRTMLETGDKNIIAREVCGVPLGTAEDGRVIEVRVGKWGLFISDGTLRAGVPEDLAPDELTLDKASELLQRAAQGAAPLGQHPETGQNVYLKSGRFGPYVQLGEAENGNKPKMASLLPKTTPEDVDLTHALKLLTLPRNLGKNPETGDDVIFSNGRFGPYVKSGTETRSVKVEETPPLDLTLEQALELLKQPKAARKMAKAAPLKEIGTHPQTGKVIHLMNGRYGPYVSDGTINAPIPKQHQPDSITLEDSVRLLQERAERIEAGGGVKKRGRKAPAAKKPAAAKKPKTPKKKAAEKSA